MVIGSRPSSVIPEDAFERARQSSRSEMPPPLSPVQAQRLESMFDHIDASVPAPVKAAAIKIIHEDRVPMDDPNLRPAVILILKTLNPMRFRATQEGAFPANLVELCGLLVDEMKEIPQLSVKAENIGRRFARDASRKSIKP